MLWFIVLGLAIWIFYQHRRLERLELTVADLKALPRPMEAPVPQASAPTRPEPPAEPLATDILLAMEEARAERARAMAIGREPILRPVLRTEPPASPKRSAPEPAHEPAARPATSRPSLETWLSENGLAWIGGAALVIGGALLVGFAAQQGLFTPPVRIVAAGGLGALLLAAGEAMRRGRLDRFGFHPLASAIASGAGASVLYGAAWAAHALYGFIPAGACAALLAAIAAGLLGLALLRGQPLALLALAGAFAAPLVAAGGDWSAPVMSLYLALLVAVGLAVATERGWRASGWVTLVGAGLWAGLALFEPSSLKCLLLGLEPLAVVVALTRLRKTPLARSFAEPSVVFAAVLGWAATVTALFTPGQALWIGGLIGVALPALTALAVRERAARGAFMAAPAVTFVLAACTGLTAQSGAHALATPILWLAQGAALGAAALWATWTRGPRTPALASAAVALVLLGALGGLWIGHGPSAALAPLTAGLLVALGLAALVRGPGAKDDPLVAETLSGAAGAALLLAVAIGAGWRFAPAGF